MIGLNFTILLKEIIDQFNLKRFILKIENGEVDIQIESNGWEDMENFFFELLPKECTPRKIKIIHALIWIIVNNICMGGL